MNIHIHFLKSYALMLYFGSIKKIRIVGILQGHLYMLDEVIFLDIFLWYYFIDFNLLQ